MFDSGQAARVLGFESFGLAYLLKRFCGVIANKEYQLADWRYVNSHDFYVEFAH